MSRWSRAMQLIEANYYMPEQRIYQIDVFITEIN